MKVSPEFLNFVMEKLSPIGEIRNRAMFGGYGNISIEIAREAATKKQRR